jgi:predicted nucleic acid-binding protein
LIQTSRLVLTQWNIWTGYMGEGLVRRVYWDACALLGLINEEADKHSDCLAVWREAERKETIIYTSFFTWAEVFKAKCEGKSKPLSEDGDKAIEVVLSQEFIESVVVDEGIGISARRLMRRHPECKKPSDGIHLASALRLSVDEMHTYDGSDLLALDGQIMSADGRYLKICPARPKPPPPPPPAPLLEPLEKK